MANQQHTEDIDMNYLFRKFKSFLKRIIKLIYSIITFFIKYWIVTLLLILIGLGWGYYKEKVVDKTFVSEGIVIPNYGSVDYLYSTIKEFNSRIGASDTVYLKSILGENHRSVLEVKIEPIADIYNTMTKSREQIDVFRILYQNQDFDKFIENLATSKYFKYHTIEFVVQGEGVSEKVIPKILDYWNQNEHFLAYQEIYKENATFQVSEYKNMFSQIDSVLASLSKGVSKNHNSSVIISDNNNVDELFRIKKEMLSDLLDANVQLNDFTDPVKLVFMNYEIEHRAFSRVIKYPFFLVGLFGFIFFLKFIFFKMKRIAESQ